MTRAFARFYRRRKALLLALAALPVFQTTGTCDPYALNALIGQSVLSLGYNLFVGATQSTLLQFFPSADLLQTLLGGNPNPFYNG